MAPAAPTPLPSPPPITDRIALGALTSTFPPELVDRVVQQTGRAEQRRRLLPARVVVYFVLALALYGHAAYEEVLRCLVEGLGWAQQARRGRRTWPWWHVPGASALAEARARLGAAPLKLLFATAARPLATKATWGRSRRCGWWGWWRPARTRSSTPSRAPMAVGSRPWHEGWPTIGAPLGAGCWCWPHGCCRRRAVAGHGQHRRGPGVADQVRQQDRPQAPR